MPPRDAVLEAPLRHVYKPLPHDSGAKHVQGSAEYIDDMPEPVGTMHIAVGGSPVARGTIRRIDLDEVLSTPGVVAVITAAHIPGKNDISPGHADEPVFAHDRVDFHGQPIFAVIATSRDTARRAALLGEIEIDAEKPNVSVEQGKASGERVLPDYAFVNGDAAKAVAGSPCTPPARCISAARSTFIWKAKSRSPFPARTARCWSILPRSIRAKCSTSSPAFWRCPTRSSRVACAAWAAALAARKGKRRMGGDRRLGGAHNRPAMQVPARSRRRLRHDRQAPRFRGRLAVGYESTAASAPSTSRSTRAAAVRPISPRRGRPRDVSRRQRLLAARLQILTRRLKTNTVSNTAFRGFGGPQGMIAIERVMDAIARERGLDPLDVRKANLYGAGRDVTPYGQTVEDYDVAPRLIEDLERSSNYRARRKQIAAFNARRRSSSGACADAGEVRHLVHAHPAQSGRRAGARLSGRLRSSQSRRHGDGPGPVHKVAQVVAEEFGIPLDRVHITATNTAKVPNASPPPLRPAPISTAWRRRSPLREIKDADDALCRRSLERRAEERIEFRDARVFIGNESMPFGELAKKAMPARVQLSDSGFYKTPKIHWDREKGKGRPFLYFAYGAACSRGRDRHADRRDEGPRASISCMTSAARSIRPSTWARSKALSSRAWAG